MVSGRYAIQIHLLTREWVEESMFSRACSRSCQRSRRRLQLCNPSCRRSNPTTISSAGSCSRWRTGSRSWRPQSENSPDALLLPLPHNFQVCGSMAAPVYVVFCLLSRFVLLYLFRCILTMRYMTGVDHRVDRGTRTIVIELEGTTLCF